MTSFILVYFDLDLTTEYVVIHVIKMYRLT